MAKLDDVARWRQEIDIAVSFREKEFGECTNDKKTKAGENLDFYERGFLDRFGTSSTSGLNVEDILTTVNIIDAIVSVIVPSLYFKNPRTIATPKRVEAESTAPIASKTIDHFRDKIEAEETNQKIIFDAYVLGYGCYKIGYATKFGRDIADEEKDKERNNRSAVTATKKAVERAIDVITGRKKEKDKEVHPEIDLRIVAESPFIEYISPFDFLIDPRATNLNNAMWWGHKLRKTVKSLKDNPKYENTSQLKGIPPETRTLDFNDIEESQQEDFETVNLFEIHYRSDNRFYLLVISEDGANEWREHYHEQSVYDIDEWQADMLMFKKHGHSLYPRSDITKVKALQNEVTETIDDILEQVRKFVPKIAYESGGISEQGKRALRDGGIGALVETNKAPKEVFHEISFTQLKSDLQNLLDQLITLISIQTGLTRAQLTGLSDASTATEANIEQGGQNIRIGDMGQNVRRFVNRQSRKLWKVIQQFVDFEELQLINGIKGIDENTGMPKYNWLLIDPSQAERLRNGEYDFDIEVGSTEQINLAVVRKAFENWFSILARTEVIALAQQQGKKIDIAEFLKKGLDAFPELGIDSSKIVQDITPETTGLVDPLSLEGRGGTTPGSNRNALEAQAGAPVPTIPNQLSEVA